MSGWPDKDRPGVPLNPERDGAHWIVGWNDGLFVAEWDGVGYEWGWLDGGDSPAGMVANGWTYAGPVLTPAEADALRLAADVQALVSETRVDLGEGFRLAARVAMAAFEQSDGMFYSASESTDFRRAHHRVKQKLEEAAEAWNIDMHEVKP